MVFPRLLRLIRSTLWLVWNKIRMPGSLEFGGGKADLRAQVPVDILGLLAVKSDTAEHDVAWTVECFSGKSKGMRGVRPNMKTLVVARKSGDPLLLVLRGLFRDQLVALPLEGARVETESKLLSDNILVQTAARQVTLRFPRGRGALVEAVRGRIEAMAASANPPAAGDKAEEQAVEAELARLPAV